MAQIARVELFASDAVAIVHVMNRTVRRCFLLGDDRFSGKNYDHRKVWIAEQLVQQARYFGIDLLCQAILSNLIHLVLRSRPDVVAESKPRSTSSSGSAARPGAPFRVPATRHAAANAVCRVKRIVAEPVTPHVRFTPKGLQSKAQGSR